ncbi:hypothetical protein FACS189423_08330 [Bacteroidia bacterium]|nr:hypothetical protein FACS189423_08330 [Bacteroidia bacterium]
MVKKLVMKKIFVLFLLAGLWTACNVDSYQTISYNVNEPVFISGEEFRNSIKTTHEVHELSNQGKICFYDGYLYISEQGKGIHIIDNTDPSHPQFKGYIEIKGNQDITVRNHLLYADALVDLVWFDISNPSQPSLKGRIENMFPNALPGIENEFGYDYEMCQAGAENGQVVVGWELKKRAKVVHYDQNDVVYNDKYTLLPGTSNGITGSMSRFGLYENYLYAVINNQLSVIDLSGEKPEKAVENLYIGNNVETIFSYKDKLFMGTPSGLVIYSVENPLNPVYCSQVAHVYGCDPVVVEDDLAYVTVHSGNFCGQNSNELIIIDVSDIKQPVQLVSYAMTHPKGLGIDKDRLFLCDAGLKIFKVTDPQTLMANQLKHYMGMDGYDVIPFDNTLMMIADKGLYQYDYSDINNIKLLSVIPVKK